MKKITLAISIVSFILVGVLVFVLSIRDNSVPISMSDVPSIASMKNIQKILIGNDSAYLYTDDKKVYKVGLSDFNIAEFTNNIPIGIKSEFVNQLLNNLIVVLVSLLIIISFFVYFINKRLKQEVKKQKEIKSIKDTILKPGEFSGNFADKVLQKDIRSDIKFSDIAGIKDVKDELIEIIDYLKNPQKYKDLSIQLPRGVLLVGPPGVGKTMIAKAVAGEANIPFFYQSGSSFVQMYVGVGAKRVRELFTKARLRAPSVIFIDEIDALGKARGLNGNDEREATLNELLSEMDGFEERSGIIVIAATNQIEVLDPALLRSGRFDRRIFIELPDVFEREQILNVYLKNKNHNLDSKEIAKMCVGFSGANLALLVNEAALNAIRHGRKKIIMQDILDTSEKVISGKKKQVSLNDSQKLSIAIYNAGKAISSYWLDEEFQKISLIGDNKVESIKHPSSKSELINKIKISLSGILALEINDLEISTIAKNDINNAKVIAHQMCEIYGMGERIITDTRDVLELIESTKAEHRDFIVTNKLVISNIANKLIEMEKLNKEEIETIVNHSYVEMQKVGINS